MHSIKISSIKTMTASPESQIQVDCILDIDHLVNNLDQSSLDLLQALIKKRISDAELAEVKKQRALSNLDALRANLVNTN
jgi:hypothetical protein